MFNLFSAEKRRQQREQRLYELNEAIAESPDSYTNYVLRGELFLQDKQYHLAADDFDQAWQLAAEAVDTARWGIVAQAMMDRAQAGWEITQRKLARRDGR